MSDCPMQIAHRGEPILTLIATAVTDQEFASAWLIALLSAMKSTLLSKNGVGIAAPQVYVSKRIIIVASHPNPRYPDAPRMQPLAMINPKILAQSLTQTWGEEGCLSVPRQRGEVARAQDIEVEYFTVDGTRCQQHFSGFIARIIQHEIDHLNGVLFVERLATTRSAQPI